MIQFMSLDVNTGTEAQQDNTVHAIACAPPAETEAWECVEYLPPQHSWVRRKLCQQLPHKEKIIGRVFHAGSSSYKWARKRPEVGMMVAGLAGASLACTSQMALTGGLVYLCLPSITLNVNCGPTVASSPIAEIDSTSKV